MKVYRFQWDCDLMIRSTPMLLMVILTSGMWLGCQVPYRKDTWLVSGYADLQLSETRFKVQFKGDSGVSESIIEDYTRLRAAELCLANGGKYFSIENKRNQKEGGHWENGIYKFTPITTIVFQIHDNKEGLRDPVDAELIRNSIKFRYNIK